MGTRGLVTLTKKDQDKIFAKLTSASKETINVRAEKTKLNTVSYTHLTLPTKA